MEYPKTENLYARDPETHKARPEVGFRHPAFDQIKTWVVTEKVDGMNMRVIFEPSVIPASHAVRVYGRTDRAQIPGDLLRYMHETFTVDALTATFTTNEDFENSQAGPELPDEVILFGEGFGTGIQKAGQAYGGTKRFTLFDVVVDGNWLSWENVKDVARKLGVPHAPELCSACDLEEAKALVATSQLQPADSEHIEGIVARTEPYLFDGRGKRVAFKYKVRDL